MTFSETTMVYSSWHSLHVVNISFTGTDKIICVSLKTVLHHIILCLMIPGDPFPIPRGCVIGGLCAVVIWKLVQNKKCKILTFFF